MQPDSPTVVRFDACWNGAQVRVLAVAHPDQIDVIPEAGHRLEIPLAAFRQFVAHALVGAHTRRTD